MTYVMLGPNESAKYRQTTTGYQMTQNQRLPTKDDNGLGLETRLSRPTDDELGEQQPGELAIVLFLSFYNLAFHASFAYLQCYFCNLASHLSFKLTLL